MTIKNLLKRTSATILVPTTNPEKPVEYNSMFPLKIDIEADLENVTDTSRIMIQVSVAFPAMTSTRS